jgi:putative hydrolase of the HAD superfamily
MDDKALAYDAILVDLFDTAVYCPWGKLRQAMAREAGVRIDDLLAGYAMTQAARNVGAYGDARKDIEEVSRAAGLDLTEAQVLALVDLERDFLLRNGDYYADTLPFLEAVRRRGLRTGIITNCSYGAETLLKRLRVRDVVDSATVSFEVGHRKPEPAVYVRAMRSAGAEARRVLLIDDQIRFCRGATAVGMSALLIKREVADRDEAPAVPYVSSLEPTILAGSTQILPAVVTAT